MEYEARTLSQVVEATIDKDAPSHVGDNSMAQYEHMVATAHRLVVDVDKSYIKLGAVLSEILRDDVSSKMGYSDSAQFFQEKLGLKRRKAYHLIAIHKVFAESGVAESDLVKLGWTKAAMIASIYPYGASADAKVVKAFVEFAMKTNENGEAMVNNAVLHGKVEEYKASLAGKAHSGPKKRKTWIFREDENAWIAKGIELAKEKFSTPNEEFSESKAVARIFQEWELMEVQGLSLDETLALVEAIHNVKLQVQAPAQGE